MRIGGDDTIETYALGNLPGQTLEDNFWLDTYRDELGINVIADISDVYEAYAADFTKETLTQEGDDPFLGIWRGNPRPFNDRDESAACFYHAINLPKA